MIKALFYLGHPAHFHLFRNAISKLDRKEYVVVIKTKDVLQKLCDEAGINYINVDPVAIKPGGSGLGKYLKMLRRAFRLSRLVRKYRPQRLVGSAAELAVLGKLHGIKSFIFFEDDFEKVPFFARIAGPFADYLICPDCCSAWKWSDKKVSYSSYHELAYLHPNVFTPDPKKVKSIFKEGERNFILRFSELGAYHDKNKSGIHDQLALELINVLRSKGNIFVSSERKLSAELEPFRIKIPASDVHHALYFADMFVGDSQTMSAEAAVLGTPSIRFNDFVGELGYLEDLEHVYGLTKGIRTSQQDQLLSVCREWSELKYGRTDWKERRDKMLNEKSDFSKCISWILTCEPGDKSCISQISETMRFQ
ncbi:MAG: DUF354 domain-containing protein [Bacteroidetes bacterium]|nr:MAG: DUF354 domain-containing protein [Bacteroidota bacterium]REK07231.1 MAG: DUF354 domain-containing protein [Bacteroidota bacterium]REK31782.1 MAG: DUF354 domain-containing protein [Bacteroidota bacterium]